MRGSPTINNHSYAGFIIDLNTPTTPGVSARSDEKLTGLIKNSRWEQRAGESAVLSSAGYSSDLLSAEIVKLYSKYDLKALAKTTKGLEKTGDDC